jgi:Holliday junction DNA helicase RuvA
MIAFIKGKVFEISPTHIILNNNDIGYFIRISLNTYSKIDPSQPVFLFTEQIFREDATLLYGFADPLEKEIFKLLTSVSGIGPNTALVILSSMESKDIQQVIANEDVAKLTAVKGIGPKTAKRAIIELKDKILKTYNINPEEGALSSSPVKEEALAALEALGYPKKRAEKALDIILKQNPSASLEETIKQALKRL